MTVNTITVIDEGETPENYRTQPGELAGPWEGETVEAIIGQLGALMATAGGGEVAQYFDRTSGGRGIWVVLSGPARAALDAH